MTKSARGVNASRPVSPAEKAPTPDASHTGLAYIIGQWSGQKEMLNYETREIRERIKVAPL